MVGIDTVLQELGTVIDPDMKKDIVSMGMITDLDGDHLNFTLELTTPACPFNTEIKGDVRSVIDRIDSIQYLDMNVMEGRSLECTLSRISSAWPAARVAWASLRYHSIWLWPRAVRVWDCWMRVSAAPVFH